MMRMMDFYGEIKLFLSSRWRVVLFLILPPLITAYYGLIFLDGVIEHSRIVIVDQDQTSVSRNLVQQFLDNKGFRLVQYAYEVDTAIDLVREEKADLVLAIPGHFSKDIKKGKNPSLLVVPNAANMAISANAMKRASEIILTFNAGIEIQKLEAKGYTLNEAEKIALPLQIHYRQTGNPSGSFYDFLVWGLIGTIGHFPIILFSAAALDRKKEKIGRKTFLWRFSVYVLFGIGELLISLLVGVAFFPMTFYGGLFPLVSLVLLVALFTMAVTALGMLLSLVIPDRAMVSQAASIVALPALILSGYTWPMSGFPWFVRVLGYLEPLTYFADPLRRLALTGRVDADYWSNCAVLLLLFLSFFGAILLVMGEGKVEKRWSKNSFDRILISNAFFLVVLVLFIGLVYQKGVLDQMDMVLVDQDQTSTSRLVARQLADNEKLRVSYAGDYSYAADALKKGETVAGVVIPSGLAEAVKSKQGGEILLVVDGANYIVANSVYAKVNEILLSINGAISLETLSGQGFLPAEANKIVQSIKLDQIILYNPDYNYSYYLSYGLFGAGIFSLAMSAFALSLCKSRQAKVFYFKELAAKTFAFTAFICVLINVLYLFAQIVFRLPSQGIFLLFFILTIGYSLLIAAFGVILFAIACQEERIFQLGVFFATTLFFTTGYTWPLQSMPEIIKPLYYLNPLTPFTNGVRACLVMGAGWGVMGKYIFSQLVLVAVYLPAGFYIRRYKERDIK